MDGEDISPLAIRLPNQSANRGKYSLPGSVLLPQHRHMGIYAIHVGDIPKKCQSPGGKELEPKIEHEPEDDNYAHSELRVYKDGDRVDKRKQINQAVRLALKNEIIEMSRIIRKPTDQP